MGFHEVMGPRSATPRIAAVEVALPEHRYPQEQLTAAFASWTGAAGKDLVMLERFHAASGVGSRNLTLPLADYPSLDGFGPRNDLFVVHALDLGEAAIRAALDAAGLRPADVDLLLVASVTGIAAPSLDARLVGRLGLRPDVKRLPVFGLGCVAGAAGIARLHDYLLAWPGQVAVLLAVELCSLTVRADDVSLPNLVASSLFGDGAAAVVAVGGDRASADAGPAVLATRSHLYPDTERVMGWDVDDAGFRVVLAAGVADVVEGHLAETVSGFLTDQDLAAPDVGSWICHPGGPKVIDAIVRALDLPPDALARTRTSLHEVGNLSSASVLHVLAGTLAGDRPAAGTPGMLLALGPGFCAEMVLLRW